VNHRILLASSGFFHPSWLARQQLRRNLQTMPGYVFQQIASLQVLPQLDTLSFRAIVLYFHHKAISSSALACLDEFVRRGGGVLAIHSATASFKQEPHYFEILGGRFREHGAIQMFEVSPTQSAEDVFGRVAPFQIRDELYIHELAPGITVHFDTMYDGERVPVVWTRCHGAGRVCYAMPGHTAASVMHATVQHILKRGLAWVCQS
jgi:type 1 glutamine amidotransferase